MDISTSRMTLEEFEAFVLLPENDDRFFEYFSGDVVERITQFHVAVMEAKFLFSLSLYEREISLHGWFVGAGVCYRIFGDLYISEGSYIPKSRMERLSTEIFCPIAPALAIEWDIQSTYSNPVYPAVKIANYLAVGTTVWVINVLQKRVEVFEPGRSVRVLNSDDTFEGGELFPGFTLPIKDIFPE
jgi:Uma2 family endonuclease